MTEYSIPLEQLADELAANGHIQPNPEPAAAEAPTARVDAARGVFITSRGDELELSGKRITSLMIERVANQGKPRIPMVEVMLLGKHKQLEANPNHEGYKALLAQWETESRLRTLKYLFTMGVKGEPPQAFIDEQTDFFGLMDEKEMKYLWVCSLIPDDDIDFFTEAVLGQNLPTEKGMAEVAESFRGEGQRQSD